MNRLKIISIIALVLLAAGGTIFFLSGPKEPVWHGKTLTQWLERRWASSFVSSTKYDDEPDRAIEAIGTNGLPTIIKLLDARDSALKTKWIDLVNGQKLIHVHLKSALDKEWIAIVGLSVLGSNALPAFPHLIKLWQHSKGQITSGLAACQLKTVAPETNIFLVALEDCFLSADTEIKRGAAELLRLNFPKDAERLAIYKTFPDLLIKVPQKPAVNVSTVNQ